MTMLALRSRAHRRVHTTVSTIAARAGHPVPGIAITWLSGPLAKHTLDGGCICYPAWRALREDDQRFTGVCAHELAHLVNRDPRPWDRRQEVTKNLLAVALFLVMAAIAAGVGIPVTSVVAAAGYPGLRGLAWITAVLAAIAVVVWPFLALERRRCRREGRDPEFAELRADLTACRWVGPEAAADLPRSHTPRMWPGWFTAAYRRIDRWMDHQTRTHPPIADRVRAIHAYRADQDPAQAARAFLHRQQR